jgi:hypothetical protein
VRAIEFPSCQNCSSAAAYLLKRPFYRSSSTTNKSRGGKVRNIYKKVKKNVHKTLSPGSVDKSVNNIILPLKFGALLHFNHVFA